MRDNDSILLIQISSMIAETWYIRPVIGERIVWAVRAGSQTEVRSTTSSWGLGLCSI